MQGESISVKIGAPCIFVGDKYSFRSGCGYLLESPCSPDDLCFYLALDVVGQVTEEVDVGEGFQLIDADDVGR